jgi:hypothetical protein
MRYLRYKMPSDLPCYSGWDFKMDPGTFLFLMPALIKAFRTRIDRDAKFAHMWRKKDGIYIEHIDCIEVLKWLERSNSGDQSIIEWDGSVRDLFWSMSRNLVYGGDYRDVECPACQTSYSPGDTTKLKWEYGEYLAAEGGHRLVCPKQHTLYSIMEWNS